MSFAEEITPYEGRDAVRPRRACPHGPVAFVAWSRTDGRAREVARALGGEARAFHDFGIVRRELVPLRYASSALRTIAFLIRRRPRAVIATNPPIFPGLIALAYARMTGAAVLLDSHPSAFPVVGARGHQERLQRLHRWLVRRVESSLVACPDLAERIAGWEARADLLHEAPPEWSPTPAEPIRGKPRIFHGGQLAPDEPTAELVEAARMLPDCEFVITGDPRRCPAALVEDAPANIRFTGFLDSDRYIDELLDANVVVSLTKRPQAVSRVASQGVWAERPVVVSGWPEPSVLFPHAVHVETENTAEDIAGAIRETVDRYDELVRIAPRARRFQAARWDEQLAVLRALTGRGHTPN